MWIFLAGDAMTFGTLLAGYGAVRFGSVDWPKPADVLGINLTAFMTFLLICSSVTMVKGLSAIAHADREGFRKFIGLTIVGGALFLLMQAWEWYHLIERGLTLAGNPWGASLFGATFFIITGFHGLHVLSGVLYLLVIFLRGQQGAPRAREANQVEIAGLYWHFVDLVWIMVFTFVYLL
jgi:heme/copper-type cytochrome/quinol oxidase subunit 3